MKFKLLVGSMMLALAIGFTGCEGEDGEIGPKGDTGAQGEQGVQGEQGPQGEKGGEEASSFGNIELTVSGVKIGGENYTQVLDFKYLPSNNLFASSWYDNGQDNNKHFTIERQHRVSASGNSRTQEGGDNRIWLRISVVDGEPVFDNVEISTAFIHDRSAMSVYSYQNSNDSDANFVISDYSYNEATGVLMFNFTYSSLQYNDETVEFAGKVNVIVFKSEMLG